MMKEGKTKPRQLKLRWWYLGHINCDCASYDHAWRRAFHQGEWPHCILCDKRLGDLELVFFGKFKSLTPDGAWKQYEAQRTQPPKN